MDTPAAGATKPRASAAAAPPTGPTEQQQRAAKVLAALEKQIGERIDRDFFAEEGQFRPLVNVIDVLGSSDGQVNNVSLERLRGQCELATMAMEKFVDENYGYLNGNVEAMGKVLRRFHETSDDVQRLRRQVRECKAALLEGLKEQNIRQMWIRKKESEYILGMLDKLDLLKETPPAFDALIADRRYLAAVTRLDQAIGAMFSPELVEVSALGRVRDEVLARKERFLDLVMEDIIQVLYLRIGDGPTGLGEGSGNNGIAAAAVAAAAAAAESASAAAGGSVSVASPSKKQPTAAGAAGAAAVEGEEGKGAGGSVLRVPAHVELTEAAERVAMEEGPGKDVGAFLCYMVEAARRLNCLDDLERFAQERVRAEVRRVGDEHKAQIHAKALNDRLANAGKEKEGGNGGKEGGKEGGGKGEEAAAVEAGGENEMNAPLLAFLRAAYADFTAIVENHAAFVRLLQSARGGAASGAEGKGSGGVPPLVAALWREIQEYVQEVLRAHIMPHAGGDAEFYLGPDALQVGNPITKAGGAGAFLRNQRWLRPLVQAGIPINPLLLGGPGALANINLNPLGLNLDPLNVGGNIQALVQDLNNLGLNLPGLGGGNAQDKLNNYNPGFFPLTINDVLLSSQHSEGGRPMDPLATDHHATGHGGKQPSKGGKGVGAGGDAALPPAPQLLCAPSVANVVPIYKPTLKFVTRVLALIGATGESALTRGVVKFLSDFVGETLLPYLSGQTNTLLRKLLEDKDALTPIATLPPTIMGAGDTFSLLSGGAFASSAFAASAEVVVAVKPPNKAARSVLELCRSLHVYTAQLPQHVDKIAQVLQVALDCYVRRIKEEFDATVAGTLAADVLAGRTEQQATLREKHLAALRADPAFLAYQAFWSGNHHGNSGGPEPPGGGNKKAHQSPDSLYTEMQPELWRMDVAPYAVTRAGLTLDKRRLLTVASLAYSADWLAHEAGKFKGKHHRSRGGHHKRSGHGNDGRIPAALALKEKSGEHWVDPIVQDLRGFAERCLLFLRLEVDYTCFYHMQQLPGAKFDAAPALPLPTPATKPGTSGLSKSPKHGVGQPSSHQQQQQLLLQQQQQQQQAQQQAQQAAAVEICVASLNRFLLSLEDALCGVATPEYYAVAMVHAPFLLPRLLTHCTRHISKVSVLGLDKLSRVLVALQQTVPILVDGMGPVLGEQAGVTQERVQEAFLRARRLLGLIELDEDQLAAYIKAHKTEFTREEYRAIWMLGSPARTVTSESGARFNAAWLS